jgi:Protein of unknown function (DUF2283)
MAVTKKVNRPALTADYDRDADVLYIAVGEPRPSESEDWKGGLVVRFPFDDLEHAWGVTVVGYKSNGWMDKVTLLADAVASILKVSKLEAATVIQQATRRR